MRETTKATKPLVRLVGGPLIKIHSHLNHAHSASAALRSLRPGLNLRAVDGHDLMNPGPGGEYLVDVDVQTSIEI